MFSFGLSYPLCTRPAEDTRTTSVAQNSEHDKCKTNVFSVVVNAISFQNQIHLNSFPKLQKNL